jgi:ribosomal protein S18 acetylase RimI-like enzyme
VVAPEAAEARAEPVALELLQYELAPRLASLRAWRVPAAVAALLVLDGVGYLDQVVTFPRARRRGFATAIASRVIADARALGAERTFLLAEPDGEAARLYERIGFRAVTQIASWISPPR